MEGSGMIIGLFKSKQNKKTDLLKVTFCNGNLVSTVVKVWEERKSRSRSELQPSTYCYNMLSRHCNPQERGLDGCMCPVTGSRTKSHWATPISNSSFHHLVVDFYEIKITSMTWLILLLLEEFFLMQTWFCFMDWCLFVFHLLVFRVHFFDSMVTFSQNIDVST